jgi:UDP-N-acetylglucosamine:LPS N-acetylglucosamine transferase
MIIFIQKILFIFIFAFISPIFCEQNLIKNDTTNLQSSTTPKKKIIIFTSKGGFWHMAACQALTSLLSPFYDVSIVNPFEEILYPYDFVVSVSGGRIDGEELYDWLIQKKWIGLVNTFCHYLVPQLLNISKKEKINSLYDYMCEQKPDLIISVIPWLNLFISDAAYKLSVPFLLITPDTDLSVWWAHGLDNLEHNNINVAIGFETSKTRPLLQSYGIDNERIYHTGSPIRQDFLEKKDKECIRKTWNIPPDKFVIMIMMGGAGSYSSYAYAQKVASLDLNVHLLVCIGKNMDLKKKIEEIKKNKTTIDCISFTNRVSDLMAVSDLLITKPGTGSVNEAVYSHLPMLIDGTDETLFLEKGNVNFVEENNFGDVATSLSEIEQIIKNYMNPLYYSAIKESLYNYERKNFSENIMQIIKRLCPTE